MTQELSQVFRKWTRSLTEFLHRHAFAVFLLLLVMWFTPMLILRQDACFTVHDSLDVGVPMRVVLANSGAYFHADGSIPQIMNGMPRACLTNALDISNLLFLILPPFPAYLLNYLFVHTIAFVGMFILLRSYCPCNGSLINAGISFAFGVLPFYSTISIAGQPFVLYAMLNILNRRDRPVDYLTLCAFPFASSLPLVGIFILLCAGGLCVTDVLLKKKLNVRFVSAISVMALLYCASEYNLVSGFFQHSFTSHRAGMDFHSRSVGLWECLCIFIRNVLAGQYHAASLHTLIILLAIPAGAFAAWRARDRRTLVALVVVTGICLAFSMVLGFQNYRGLIPLKERFPILAVWQFGRFHFLHPTMWYFAFGISTIAISKLSLGDFGSGKRIAYGLVCAQILYVLARNAEFTDTMRVLVNRAIGRVDNRISYSRFYSEPLFRGIESAIGKPKETYRVVSIGLHPGIAIYNGFYTLDFYSVNYPLSYKHLFRHLIDAELEKSSQWRLYYDGWGSRCYVFVDELASCMTTKYDNAKVEHLAFNTQMFKSMGGVYIFSAAEIVNHAENSLSFEGVFEDSRSPWRIYLYKAE